MYMYIYIYIYICGTSRRAVTRCTRSLSAPSHRRGTLKGVPTVKSPNVHFQITF